MVRGSAGVGTPVKGQRLDTITSSERAEQCAIY